MGAKKNKRPEAPARTETDAPLPKVIKSSDESSTNKFMKAWAWKREHLPDRLRFQRPYKYPMDCSNPAGAAREHIIVHQRQFDAEGFASTVWDSSIVMAKYLEAHPDEVAGKRVCDLSAGTGLVGLVAAKLGADVVATDLEGNMPLLEKNMDANGVSLQTCCHWWGTPVDDLKPPFDVVVACDVMYIKEAVVDLEKSLGLLASKASAVYIAHGRNCCAEDDFLAVCTANWIVEIVPQEHWHPEYQADDISVWKLRKK